VAPTVWAGAVAGRIMCRMPCRRPGCSWGGGRGSGSSASSAATQSRPASWRSASTGRGHQWCSAVAEPGNARGRRRRRRPAGDSAGHDILHEEYGVNDLGVCPWPRRSPPCGRLASSRPRQRQVADAHPDCIGGSSVTPKSTPRRWQRNLARASSGCCDTSRRTCLGLTSRARCPSRRAPSAHTSATSTPSWGP